MFSDGQEYDHLDDGDAKNLVEQGMASLVMVEHKPTVALKPSPFHAETKE